MSKKCVFVNKSAIRKRKTEDSDSDGEIVTPIYLKRKRIEPVLVFVSYSYLFSKKENTVHRYEANKTSEKSRPTDMGATSQLEVDTETSKDAQSIFERVQKDKKKADDGLYHGLQCYDRLTEAKDTIAGNAASGFNRKGPMRAPTNIRSTTRWDYQPDICKDYKETGFCGFGDSCKFLHDRSDYKFGWQLEQEELNAHSDDSDDDKYEIHSSDEEDANIPHFCSYCRKEFVEPVVSKCMHYFCSKCAVEMDKKLKGKCKACNKSTESYFKNADYIFAKIQAIEDKRNKKAGSDSDD